jgi:hypothetical protein
MPAVKISLFLCLERQKKTSFWKPYIETLPSQLNLPMFWSREEILSLRGSVTYGLAIQQLIGVLMQYIRLHAAVAVS